MYRPVYNIMYYDSKNSKLDDQRPQAKSMHIPNSRPHRDSPMKHIKNEDDYYSYTNEPYIFYPKNSFHAREVPRYSNDTYVKAKTSLKTNSNRDSIKSTNIEISINGHFLTIDRNCDLNNESVFTKIKDFIWSVGPMSKSDRLALLIKVIKDLSVSGAKKLEKVRYEGLLLSFTRQTISQGR